MKTLTRAAALTAVLLAGVPALAQEAGCTLNGATAVPEVEALNALVKEARFNDLTAELAKTIPGLPADVLAQIAGAYPAPFTSCVTLVQRQDGGDLTQHVVVFEGEQPLFVYWASGPFAGTRGVVLFNMDSGLGPVMDMLR